jgi:hypothetical protein
MPWSLNRATTRFTHDSVAPGASYNRKSWMTGN